MGRRAFSLIELLLVVALTALTIGVTVALYGYSVNRLAQATSRFAAVNQVQRLQDDISGVVRDSVVSTAVAAGTGTALKCTLAAESKRGATTIGSSAKSYDLANPINVTKRGYDKHGTGKRVWFFLANEAGTYGTSGTTVWRAERSDDSVPTAADVVAAWRFYPGTTSARFALITSMSFVVNSTTRTVTTTIGARSLWRAERSGTVADADSQSYSEARTTCWRHWFQ